MRRDALEGERRVAFGPLWRTTKKPPGRGRLLTGPTPAFRLSEGESPWRPGLLTVGVQALACRYSLKAELQRYRLVTVAGLPSRK
jgi:hypothetical protein